MNNAVGPIFNEKIDKKWNLWVREQCTDALFTEDRSKVAATVHVPYMNSTVCWGKRREKKKKKKEGKCRNLKRSKRGSKLCLNKNIPCKYFLLMLPCGFLHLMLSCGLYTCHFYVSGGDSKTWHMWLDFICWLSTVDMSSIGN